MMMRLGAPQAGSEGAGGGGGGAGSIFGFNSTLNSSWVKTYDKLGILGPKGKGKEAKFQALSRSWSKQGNYKGAGGGGAGGGKGENEKGDVGDENLSSFHPLIKIHRTSTTSNQGESKQETHVKCR